MLGLAVMIAPEDVPGLSLPDSPEASHAMGMEAETENEMDGDTPASGGGMSGAGMEGN
jgi:hypothetical protein